MPRPFPPHDDDGYMAILAALALLVLVSIVSIAASRIAGTEVTMAGNETVTRRNFYLAEAAVMEAVDRLDNLVSIKDADLPWLEPVAGKLDLETVRDAWDNESEPGATPVPQASIIDPAHVLYLAGMEGVAPGFSMGMNRTRVHVFGLYGRCVWNGVSAVKVGYLAPY